MASGTEQFIDSSSRTPVDTDFRTEYFLTFFRALALVDLSVLAVCVGLYRMGITRPGSLFVILNSLVVFGYLIARELLAPPRYVSNIIGPLGDLIFGHGLLSAMGLVVGFLGTSSWRYSRSWLPSPSILISFFAFPVLLCSSLHIGILIPGIQPLQGVITTTCLGLGTLHVSGWLLPHWTEGRTNQR